MNIVLAHGILGFDKIALLNLEYFSQVKNYLEKRFNARVLTTRVDPTRGVEFRGDQLRSQIIESFSADEKLHIIAHSMGGLDSRYLLSPNNQLNADDNFAERVISLVTIGTPHKGTPIADAFYNVIDGKQLAPVYESVEIHLRTTIEQLLNISFQGLEDLTTTKSQLFNERFADSPLVKYFSVAGVGRESRWFPPSWAKTCAYLLFTHTYIKAHGNEDNDGLVSLTSAQHYPAINGTWPADHFDEVGHNLDLGQVRFNYLQKYEETVEHIKQFS